MKLKIQCPNLMNLSRGLNLETLNTILSGTKTIFEPRRKFFKFGLRQYKLRRVVSEVSSFIRNEKKN